MAGKSSSLSVAGMVLLVFGAGVLLRLFWLALGLVQLRRLKRNAVLMEAPPAAIDEMRRRLGVTAPIFLSRTISGPMSFGVSRPIVMLPERLLEMSEDKQRAVVCHELLHIRRRDWSFVIVEELIRALFWFHPVVWWALGRIGLSREQWVDCETLRVAGSRQAYLQSLVEFAAGPPETAPAMPFLKQGHLTRRVALILKEDSMTKPRLFISLAVISLALFAVGGLAVKSAPLHFADFGPVGSMQDNTPPRVKQDALKVIHKVQPPYPQEAKEKRIEGKVVVELEIDEEGKVARTQVIEGDETLREATLNAARQWLFEPYKVDGKASPVSVSIAFNFTLK